MWWRYRIAYELRRTVEELGSMSAEEFTHWIAWISERDRSHGR